MNKLTAKGANFGAHAAANEDVANNLELELDYLAMAAATDKSTIDKLTETNRGLMAQLDTTIATIQRLTEDNQQLLCMVEATLPNNKPHTTHSQKG